MKKTSSPDPNAITTDQMKHLAGDNLDVMTNAVAAYNHKWGNILSADECKDLVMQAYLNACDSAWTFCPERASLRTWLGKIAHNLAYNAVLRKLRMVRLDQDFDLDTEDEEQTRSASAQLTRSERDQLLVTQWAISEEALAFEERRKARLQRECWMAAYQALSDTDQLLLYMRYDLKLPEAEMARQLHMTYGALRTALSRSRDRFEAELEARHFKEIDEWTLQYFHQDNDLPYWEGDDDETFFGGRSEANG